MHTEQIAQLLQNQQTGYSLAQPFYTSPQIFNLEWQHILKQDWLFAGNTAQIPKAGDFFIYKHYSSLFTF